MPRIGKPVLPANDGSKQRIAELVYSLLKESAQGCKTHGIDLVRPPNPKYGDAVAVIMSDGRDVIIRFEEAPQ
jgi:hypothetical protein